jgi:glycerol-3-phosphate O-acyltransferase
LRISSQGGRLRARRLGPVGRLMLWLLSPFFRRVTLDAGAAAGLAGSVLYVLRAFSRIERYYIEWAIRQRRLRPGPVVFLRPRSPDLETLVLNRPDTTVVPVLIVWGRAPVRRAHVGEDDEPPTIRLLRRGSSARIGQPLSVAAFLAEHGEAREEVLASRLRWEVSGRLERERQVSMGPPRKTARRLMKEIARSRRMVADAQAIARREGLTAEKAYERIVRCLREIAADIRPWMLRVMRPLLGYVWNRIYDGIDVDQAGIQRVREAARRGSLILCPSHKSHIDYLVLSYVFHEHGLAVPHIAAGANLSFWPLGYIFRRGGAFFLRRTFKGDPLYAAVFRNYVRKLVDERVPIEFFIEGGRSRTGKLLGPKLGLLSMVCEAASGQGRRRPQVVPISIQYEKVIEEKSYAEELGGGEKKAEDVRGLLGAGKVLSGRYGRVDIQFDEPFDLIEAMGEGAAGDDVSMRASVRRVAHRIMYGIARATAVTPSALWASVLLASGARGISRADAERAIAVLEERARRAGARFPAPYLKDREESLERALELVSASGVERRGDLLLVADERRPALDYYKNGAMNWFVAESLVSLAQASLARRAAAGQAVARTALREATLALSRLLKLEFVYRVGASFEVIFEETLAGLLEAGWLVQDGGAVGVTPAGREPTTLLSGLSINFVEGYLTAARTLAAADKPIAPRELVKTALLDAERLYYQGGIKRRESVSKTVIGNALDYFRERALVREEAGKLIARCEEAAAEAERIQAFLD